MFEHNGMWRRQFELVTDTQPQNVIKIVSQLLRKRSVEHTVGGNCITSTDIPIILLNWDKRMFSRDNFIGINPFIFIDRLTVEVKPESESKTRLHITANRGRAYIPLIFIIPPALWVLMVENSFAGLMMLIFAVLYYLFTFQVVVGRLLLREIERALRQAA
jgi:hypothetical protein